MDIMWERQEKSRVGDGKYRRKACMKVLKAARD